MGDKPKRVPYTGKGTLFVFVTTEPNHLQRMSPVKRRVPIKAVGALQSLLLLYCMAGKE